MSRLSRASSQSNLKTRKSTIGKSTTPVRKSTIGGVKKISTVSKSPAGRASKLDTSTNISALGKGKKKKVKKGKKKGKKKKKKAKVVAETSFNMGK